MKKTGLNRFVRLTCLILAAAFLLLPTGAATATGKHNGPPFYNVTVSVDDKYICVGQSTKVWVAYKLSMGPEMIVPLISIEPDNGETPPGSEFGGMGRGMVSFDFTGTKPGLVKIWGFVNRQPEPEAGSDFEIVHVRKCDYSYKLTVKLLMDTASFSLIYEGESIMESEGTFSLSFAYPPTTTDEVLTGKLNVLQFNVMGVPEACEPKPEDWIYKGEPGTVGVAVRGYTSRSGLVGLRIIFKNPDVGGTTSFKWKCYIGQEDVTYDLPNYFSGQDPWIAEDFPRTGGTIHPRIPFYRDVVRKLSALPGFKASLFTELTVKLIDDTQP